MANKHRSSDVMLICIYGLKRSKIFTVASVKLILLEVSGIRVSPFKLKWFIFSCMMKVNMAGCTEENQERIRYFNFFFLEKVIMLMKSI